MTVCHEAQDCLASMQLYFIQLQFPLSLNGLLLFSNIRVFKLIYLLKDSYSFCSSVQLVTMLLWMNGY